MVIVFKMNDFYLQPTKSTSYSRWKAVSFSLGGGGLVLFVDYLSRIIRVDCGGVIVTDAEPEISCTVTAARAANEIWLGMTIIE